MSNVSKDVFSAYYQALPSELQSLHMYFRAAKHYHKVHRAGSLTSMQKRRWAREELNGHVATEYGPAPMLRQCERLLATDREQRIARVRQRRPKAEPAPLRINLRGGWGEVVPFARTRQAAECPSELVAAQA